MVTLAEIDLPMIFKDRLLFSHGFHNNWNILPEEVEKSMILTNWGDQRNRSLFYSHHERDAQKWVGRIQNPHVINGELFGDLEIHDADLALKLGPGKAPIGVSAEIRWPPQFNDPTNFTYKAFAMVPNPEVIETLVNFSKQTKDGFNTAKIHAPFMENAADFSDGIVTSQTARGSSVVEDVEKEKSNFMSVERRLKEEMEEKNAKNVEEVKEEKVVETVEETPEETKEVTKEETVDKTEESKEADFSVLSDKIDAFDTRLKTLEEKQAKFSEESEKSEEVEDEAKEEDKEKVDEEVPAEKVETEEPDTKEKATEEESKEKSKEESKEADFSKVVDKLDKIADAMSKKEAAPMSTAEFGSKGIDNNTAVIDRLTKSLSE